MQQTPVLNNIVEQYADEIAFLYTQRQNALSSPVYYLDEIQALENRLIAHLEGLKLGGVIGWEYCEENLQFEQAGELFAAAFSAVHMQDMDKLDQVFDVAGEEAVLLDAIADAFIWQFHEFTPMLANGLYNTKKPQKMYTALCLYRSIASVPDTVV
ncbi:MAG TPA: hypothetical protein ENK06_03265, partial [Gammaproteobacteria bacterium]|nr:hypothetical protein [Gammaproteobacteria bacterium]